MARFGDAVKRAREGDDDRYDPPDGTYRCRLVDAGAFTTRTSGRDKVKLVWLILDPGEHHHQRFTDFNDIDETNPTGIRITWEKLLLLGLPSGFEPDDIEDLDHELFNVIGVEAEVLVAHKDTFLNPVVLRTITGQSDVTPSDEQPAPADPPPAASGRDLFARGVDDSVPF